MFRKLIWSVLFGAFALLTTVTVAQDASQDQAFLRILQLASDVKGVSLALQDGTNVLTNLAPFSFSGYLPYQVNRSTSITLTITPNSGLPYAREWLVPPLSPGHHTIALVGSSADNSLDLMFIDEDHLCEGKLASGSCLILVNNIKGSPPLTMMIDNVPVVDDIRYRQVVVSNIAAGSYHNFTIVDRNNPQVVVFQFQRGFYEPNVIYIYPLVGSYPGRMNSDYNSGTIRRVPVDMMTFLRGLTAKLQLTNDGQTLYSMENIVAILDQSGLSQTLTNAQPALTVFAPTDGGVLNVAPALYACVTGNPDAMKALILNHILVGSYTSSQLLSAGQVTTMAGTTHTFSPASGGFLIDNAVTVSDAFRYPTSNGMLYLIDTVLVPPGFAQQYCGG